MGTLLSAANWPIVGQIAILLGKEMNVIYNTLDNVLPTDHGLVDGQSLFTRFWYIH